MDQDRDGEISRWDFVKFFKNLLSNASDQEFDENLTQLFNENFQHKVRGSSKNILPTPKLSMTRSSSKTPIVDELGREFNVSDSVDVNARILACQKEAKLRRKFTPVMM